MNFVEKSASVENQERSLRFLRKNEELHSWG